MSKYYSIKLNFNKFLDGKTHTLVGMGQSAN
jgi:hypothetical protein